MYKHNNLITIETTDSNYFDKKYKQLSKQNYILSSLSCFPTKHPKYKFCATLKAEFYKNNQNN